MATRNNRLTYIDNLRIFLTILVITLHSAVTYGSEGGWYYKEATQDMAAIIPLTMLAAICQSFFMGLFFFIGGYFSPGSLDRKGFLNFLVDRLKRLGIPCVLFAYAIGPLALYLTLVLLEGGSFVYDQSIGIGILWFAQALLLFSGAYALGRVMLRTRPSAEQRRPFPTLRKRVFFVFALSVVTFIVRYFYPRGTGHFGMIYGDFPQYIAMFALGVVAYRNQWLASLEGAVKTRRLGIALIILILLLPVMMVFGEDAELGFDLFMGGLYWQAAAYAAWESAMCVVVSLLLLKVFASRYGSQGSLAARMSASAYTVYIIHPVILIVGSYALLGSPLHPLLKFALLAPSGTVVTFAVADLVRRIPLLRSIL